jgi:hypothetical protein
MGGYSELFKITIEHQYYNGAIPIQYIDINLSDESQKFFQSCGMVTQISNDGIIVLYSLDAVKLECLASYYSEAIVQSECSLILEFEVYIKDSNFFKYTTKGVSQPEHVILLQNYSGCFKKLSLESSSKSKNKYQSIVQLHKEVEVNQSSLKRLDSPEVCYTGLKSAPTMIIRVGLDQYAQDIFKDIDLNNDSIFLENPSVLRTTHYKVMFGTRSIKRLYWIWFHKDSIRKILGDLSKASDLYIENIKANKNKINFILMEEHEFHEDRIAIKFLSSQMIPIVTDDMMGFCLKIRTILGDKTLLKCLANSPQNSLDRIEYKGDSIDVTSVHVTF